MQITATRFVVPEHRQSSAELAILVDRDESWISQNVGVSNRHVCQPGSDPAQFAALAARPVIDECGEPDLLIYASASVRQCIPETSVFVARELGLTGVPSFSVNATCLSFIVALHNAASLIQNGSYKKILIVSAEQPTLSRNFAHAESAALFGDAAAAVMLEATDRDCGVKHFKQATWPEYAELCQVRGGGLLRHPENGSTCSADYLFEMDGESLLRVVLPRLLRFIKEFFGSSDFSLEDVDLIIPHQASAAGMKLLTKIGVPADRTMNILSEYGNCVSASIPMAMAIAQQEGRIKPGANVLLIGTAAGISIGATLLKW